MRPFTDGCRIGVKTLELNCVEKIVNVSNMKIGVRLTIGFAVTLALLIVVAVLGIARISGLNEDVQLMTHDRFPKTVQANNIIDAVNGIAIHVRDANISTGAEQQKSLEGIAAERKIIDENLAKLDATIKSDKGKEILNKLKESRVT
jgi:methyl-accepting chemotaxis protein